MTEAKNIQELAKEARREYYREYRAKNPEKVKAAARRYWERKAALKLSAQEDK